MCFRDLTKFRLLSRQLAIKIAWRIRREERPDADPIGLRKVLLDTGRLRWLDVGCGNNFADGFHHLDWYMRPPEHVDPALCFQADIANLTEIEAAAMGKFDFIRMQHVLEHFTFEDGVRVVRNCARLLNPNGLLLISVPDLYINVQAYLCNGYSVWRGFTHWTETRIPKGAPVSFAFSLYAHSFGHSPQSEGNAERSYQDTHKWCYDYSGLRFVLNLSGGFESVQRLGLLHPLAAIPFTHNRPDEDVCVLAQRNA